MMTTDTIMLMTYAVLTSRWPIVTDSCSKIGGNGWANTPNIHFIRAWNTIDSPIVTMITAMIGSPISGRSTTTCSITPNSTMKASVIKKPQMNGSWYLVSSHQHTQAP